MQTAFTAQFPALILCMCATGTVEILGRENAQLESMQFLQLTVKALYNHLSRICMFTAYERLVAFHNVSSIFSYDATSRTVIANIVCSHCLSSTPICTKKVHNL